MNTCPFELLALLFGSAAVVQLVELLDVLAAASLAVSLLLALARLPSLFLASMEVCCSWICSFFVCSALTLSALSALARSVICHTVASIPSSSLCSFAKAASIESTTTLESNQEEPQTAHRTIRTYHHSQGHQ